MLTTLARNRKRARRVELDMRSRAPMLTAFAARLRFRDVIKTN
jgi:hypothetical protein